MKISNSKKELARIISENGGWRDGAEWATQDHVVAFFSGGKPKYETCDKTWCANGDDGVFIVAMSVDGKIGGFHNTILSRAEYFRLYPAPDADGWIEWKGGECPVGGDVMVVCKVRTGEEFHNIKASNLRWRHTGDMSDIITYRLPPARAKPEFCESVMRTIPEPEAKPTIDQLLQDWRNADDLAKRKQAEADEAAAMRDERWQAVQERAGEIGVTVELCESVASEPELDITDWRDLRVGDRIWVGDSGYANNCPAGEYDIVARACGDDGQPIGVMWCGCVQWLQIHERGWRFIRRP